jgi:hypothetical protein
VKRPLIPSDDALPASSLQAAAELRRLIGRAEWTNHGAVVDTLFVAQTLPATLDWLWKGYPNP